jgi:glutamine synthetase
VLVDPGGKRRGQARAAKLQSREGMHTNLSVTRQSTNLFYEKDGKYGLSAAGWDFISRILASAPDICLVLNSSVNS